MVVQALLGIMFVVICRVQLYTVLKYELTFFYFLTSHPWRTRACVLAPNVFHIPHLATLYTNTNDTTPEQRIDGSTRGSEPGRLEGSVVKPVMLDSVATVDVKRLSLFQIPLSRYRYVCACVCERGTERYVVAYTVYYSGLVLSIISYNI